MRPISHKLKTMLAILFSSIFACSIALIFFSAAPTKASPPSDLTQSTDVPVSVPDLLPTLDFMSNGNGTCTVVGIGTCTATTLVIPTRSPAGDRVTAIAEKAFWGNDFLIAVHIPDTVAFIGDLAFAGCKSLALFSVDENNSAYQAIDGVLYSKDQSALILYPPKHASTTVSIDPLTTEIKEMAFYHCAYLKHLSYSGSPSQWESISVGPKNYSLLAISKEFSHEAKDS